MALPEGGVLRAEARVGGLERAHVLGLAGELGADDGPGLLVRGALREACVGGARVVELGAEGLERAGAVLGDLPVLGELVLEEGDLAGEGGDLGLVRGDGLGGRAGEGAVLLA